jgi:hypothetical protein
MQSISRRGFVISATAGGCRFRVSTGRWSFSRPAFAQKADKRLRQFKVGDVEVIQMYDGVWEKAHDPGFVKNASLDDVQGRAEGRRADRRTRADHVHGDWPSAPGHRSCCSTRVPAPARANRGRSSPRTSVCRADGHRPATVDTIIITHFHGDHITHGLMAKDTNAPDASPTPPSTCRRAEYKFWTDPSVTAGAPSASRR